MDDEPEVFDAFANTKKIASLMGDMRGCLIEEGFTPEQAFELVLSLTDQEAFTP